VLLYDFNEICAFIPKHFIGHGFKGKCRQEKDLFVAFDVHRLMSIWADANAAGCAFPLEGSMDKDVH
ncbi:MAG: hypothetical protein NC180_13185, partial [Muribaculaceae bacterium]|nr:hypothetical protein [Muribaculaceae bacterium]